MTNQLDKVLNDFNQLTKKPVDFLSTQDNLETHIRVLIKTVYDFTKSEEKSPLKDTLSELIIEDFDEEQLWQEIELQNNAVWHNLVHDISASVINSQKLTFPIEVQSIKIDESNDEDLHLEYSEDSNSMSENDIELKRRDIATPKEKQKGQKSSIVDDGFFKLRDMEQFLISEDKKENKKRDLKLNESDDDSINFFDDLSSEESEPENDSKPEIRYEDFFGEPGDEREGNEETMSNDDDVESDQDENESRTDLKSAENEDNVKKNHMRTESSSEDSESDSAMTASNKNENIKLSDFELRQQRLKQKITKLEEHNLAEKPWQLKGEVDASSRPQNSLLEEIVDFDLTSRPLPIITEETTFKLEDIIKQRIKDKIWDDVERKEKPVQDTNVFKKAVVLDQEKSKMSLSQVYEQEYLKQKRALAGTNDESEKEPKEHKEIREAMKNLFNKLDALSNYHYTPKAAQPEIKIISNLPAITLEEVAPVASSEAALLAPEEVKAKRKGELMSKAERTSTDMNRERRKKKKRQREQAKDKGKIEKVVNKLKPGLGNKYSKEKISKILRSENKVLDNEKALKSSKAFFSQLDDMKSVFNTKKGRTSNISAKTYKL